MEIAILGTDADIVRLASAAVAEGHVIAWIGDVRPQEASAIHGLAPRLHDRAAEWESLLDGAVADAVIVGRGTASDGLRAEQLKRIATEGVPLLAVHPIAGSVLAYYEVDMIRRETGGIVRHYNPLAGHPIVDLSACVRDGHPTVGLIHQVTCERRVAEAARGNVLRHLARDIELLAATAGDIRRVSAIGPETSDVSYASLQVQMTTDGPASLRWAVGSPAIRGQGLEMTLVGERGTIKLIAPDDSDEWHLEVTGDEDDEGLPLPVYNAPLACVQQFAVAVTIKDSPSRAEASTWDKATRAMEVVDAVELSLQKGRMIDVYQQHLTARLAFRGTMAAVGCGLLLFSFVVIVVVTVLGGAEARQRPQLLPSWPIALLAVLALFLLLQALPLLASKLTRRGGGGAKDESASQATRLNE